MPSLSPWRHLGPREIAVLSSRVGKIPLVPWCNPSHQEKGGARSSLLPLWPSNPGCASGSCWDDLAVCIQAVDYVAYTIIWQYKVYSRVIQKCSKLTRKKDMIINQQIYFRLIFTRFTSHIHLTKVWYGAPKYPSKLQLKIENIVTIIYNFTFHLLRIKTLHTCNVLFAEKCLQTSAGNLFSWLMV